MKVFLNFFVSVVYWTSHVEGSFLFFSVQYPDNVIVVVIIIIIVVIINHPKYKTF